MMFSWPETVAENMAESVERCPVNTDGRKFFFPIIKFYIILPKSITFKKESPRKNYP